ncbi:hypothetical protein [Streptomyces sp. WM6378]|uniref:hypothetical protein n=1 Tax=Streptomyces sp. WM6378 TaxID=1415557 RepID=UPI00131AE01F|nr:hypothetical protein [Streptomyces sp. WM6378]
MIKQVLTGAAFATAATMAVAAPASANTPVPQGHKTAAEAIQSVLAAAAGPTTSGTGAGCNCGTVSGAASTVTNLTGTSSLTSPVSSAVSNPTGTVSSAAGNPTGAVSNLTGTTGNLTGATGGLTGAGSGTSATGSGDGATAFSTRNGDTVITGADGDGAGGILNTYGASLANIDGRCLVPLPEGEGIGGHGLTGPKAACNIAPVDQYEAPQKLL